MEYLNLLPSENRILNSRTGEVWAEIAPFSIAAATDRIALDAIWPGREQAGRLILSPGEAKTGDSGDAIATSFQAWSESGKEELEIGMRIAVDVCRERDCELLVWPKIGSLVSDIPGLLSLSRKYEDVGVFLEPAALFPAGEQFRLTDFVDRFVEVLAQPSVCAVFFDAERAKSMGGLAAFTPLARLASELEKPIVLRGATPENAAAIFGVEPE